MKPTKRGYRLVTRGKIKKNDYIYYPINMIWEKAKGLIGNDIKLTTAAKIWRKIRRQKWKK